MAEVGPSSTARRSRRRRNVPLQNQEEEDDDGFRFTRRSKRLRNQKASLVPEDKSLSSEELKKDESYRFKKKQEKATTDVAKSAETIDVAKRAETTDVDKRAETIDVDKSAETIDVDKSAETTGVAKSAETSVSNEQIQKNKRPGAKKKRRSSFIRGRKLHSPSDLCKSEEYAAVEGLYKDIPAELSSDERLLLLFDKSLMLMCDRLKTKSKNNAVLAEKAEEFVSHLRSTLQESSLAMRVQSKEGEKNERCERIIIPNPKNVQLEEYAKKSQQVTKRMLQEDEDWEDLVSKYESKSELHESQMEDEKNDEAVMLDSLSSEQKHFLDSTPPVGEILERLDTLKSKSFLMIDELAKANATVKEFNDVSEHYIQERTKILDSASGGSCATPRRLIQEAMGKSEKVETT